jgi:hypothetical protein
MILSQNFILFFGKHETFSLAEIYQYDPTYIDWLIKYIPEFEIDLSEFNELPKPTVQAISTVQIPTTSGKAIDYPLNPNPKASVADIKKDKNLVTLDFKFSKDTLRILAEKKAGIYQYPKWEPLKYGISYSFEELLQCLKNWQR